MISTKRRCGNFAKIFVRYSFLLSLHVCELPRRLVLRRPTQHVASIRSPALVASILYALLVRTRILAKMVHEEARRMRPATDAAWPPAPPAASPSASLLRIHEQEPQQSAAPPRWHHGHHPGQEDEELAADGESHRFCDYGLSSKCFCVRAPSRNCTETGSLAKVG